MLDHFHHLLLLLLQVLLALLLLQLDLLFLRKRCPLFFELLFLLSLLRDRKGLSLIVVFSFLGQLHFSPHLLSLGLVRLREVKAGHSVNNFENHLKNLKCVFMFAVCSTNLDARSEEHFMFVVDLLVGDVEV